MSRTTDKMTPLRVQILLDNIEAGNSIATSCRLAGIGRTTLEHWIKRGKGEHDRLKQRPEDVEFLHRYEDAQARFEDKLVKIVMKDAETSPRMALAILKSRVPAWRGLPEGEAEGDKEIEVVFKRDWQSRGREGQPPGPDIKAVK